MLCVPREPSTSRSGHRPTPAGRHHDRGRPRLDALPTHRVADAWAGGHGIVLDRLHEGLEESGGSCDCEVVVNVDPVVVLEDAQAAPGPAVAGPSVR
ncbi:uncharacterized protein DUF2695 [Geodermatophilus normandii]|uniref:Uncharacterized protein DUF2695 n=1 Tax=Geodermatophilus normandii TaxID=1137989 RepID=A0A317QIV3_9ACTN|nr:uncharacterized protein DUF2695 [Geodermatophilus normandii]